MCSSLRFKAHGACLYDTDGFVWTSYCAFRHGPRASQFDDLTVTSRSSIHTGSGSKNKQDKGFLVICRDLFCEKLFGKKDPFARASVWYVVCRSTRSDSL